MLLSNSDFLELSSFNEFSFWDWNEKDNLFSFWYNDMAYLLSNVSAVLYCLPSRIFCRINTKFNCKGFCKGVSKLLKLSPGQLTFESRSKFFPFKGKQRLVKRRQHSNKTSHLYFQENESDGVWRKQTQNSVRIDNQRVQGDA